MSKLVKRLENGTDFDVCVFLLKSGKYAVTVYDNVNRTHEKQDVFDDLADALVLAKKLNKNYRIDESKTNKGMKKNVVKINENTLRQIVAESVKKVLKEGIMSGGHSDAIRQTYDTVGELLNLWGSVRGSDGKYTEVGNKITQALYNVITTIEQVDRDALDGDEGSEFSPYGLKPFSR